MAENLPNDLNSIMLNKPEIVIALMEKGRITAEHGVKAFPQNREVILVAYQKDPSVIKTADASIIVKLLGEGLISPADAISAFPTNEDIIKKAEAQAGVLVITKEKELIALINKGQLSPHEAVQNNPKNIAIVEAAYRKTPASIQFASKEAINTLGANEVIKMKDVLEIFSISEPTKTELKQTRAQFDAAIKNGKWDEVAKICEKFWFERPPYTNREDIVSDLNSRWQALYAFEKALNKEEYQLTYGPLQKSQETYQLEALARKMMTDGIFSIETINGEDHFIFKDGTQFNWTKIQKNADLQHINLQEEDFALYKNYVENHNYNGAKCTLDPNLEGAYRKTLYGDEKIPPNPIQFAEMQAINIFTGEFFESMNGLMRDEVNKFDYRTGEIGKTRAALVHSVMAASGLTKIPITNMKVSYRGANLGGDEEQQKRIQAAAKKGVIELNGFVSSSIEEKKAFQKQVLYTFRNLRGAFIAAISQNPEENEFLIPATQAQITSYEFKDYQYQFEATLVSELGIKNKENIQSINIAKEPVLHLAKPEIVLALLNKGEINPVRAVQAFPKDKQIVLAAFSRDMNSIQYASPMLLESLEKPPIENKPSSTESFAALDIKLFKIKNFFVKEGALNANYVRELSKATCKTSTLGINHFSEKTNAAKYIIDRIATNKDLCEAFGIDYSKSKEAKSTSIKDILHKAFNEKPLMSSKTQQPGSQGNRI